MSASLDLIDKYKTACSITSDNACAVSLGLSRSTVSLWRNGKGHPEADTVERMCEATGESLARWLPLIEAERARTPSARKAWLRLAQVAAAITLTVGVFGPSSAAHAEIGNFAKTTDTVYYVKFWMRLRRSGTTVVHQLTLSLRQVTVSSRFTVSPFDGIAAAQEPIAYLKPSKVLPGEQSKAFASRFQPVNHVNQLTVSCTRLRWMPTGMPTA